MHGPGLPRGEKLFPPPEKTALIKSRHLDAVLGFKTHINYLSDV